MANDLFATNFSSADWWIVGIYISASLLVGIVATRVIHSVKAYLVGGGAAGTSLNVATYIGSGLGLVTLMYASIEAFSNGFAYVTLALVGLIVGVILGRTGFVIHRLRELNLLTIPEYFEKRFDRRTRIAGGIICVVSGVLNMGLFPKMGAVFITYASGLGNAAADHATTVNTVTTILILMVLVYTVMGGMVSVIITDYVQFVVLSLGMGLGLYFCFTHADLGWGTMTQTLAEHRGERMFNPVAEDGYGWVWIIFNFMVALIAGVCWAPESSRALTARDPGVAKRTFLLAAPGAFARLGIPALWAIAAFTMVSQRADLTAHFFPDGLQGDAVNAAQAMPLLLGTIVPAGLLGILVAGLLAAFMSTHDSYLLCWASVFTRDVVAPLRQEPLSDRQQIFVTRCAVVAIGLFILTWGIWYELPSSVWTYMAVTGTIYLSGAGVALIGGVYWKRGSATGAFATLLAGLVAVVGIFTEQLNAGLSALTGRDIAISGHEIGFFNFFFCTAIFVVFSLLFPDRPKQAENNH